MQKTTFNFVIVVVLGWCFAGYSQIGIGTTSPDASAALDISSTTQGVLCPRVTTAQRQAISSPATGLLIYDTDVNSFYFYDGAQWTKMESETRTNYKLVQSASDLADELTAGGGTKYLLDENYLYEINGNVVVTYPIDLNGAYISGEDANEDMITNASSDALFITESNGGSIRNITANGNGKAIFDITGTGTESLVINNTIFYGAGSLGNIRGLNIVFFSICEYVANENGFSFSNNTSLFMNNLFWEGSNLGTFATLSGTFRACLKIKY